MQAKADLRLGSEKLGRKCKHHSGYRENKAPKNPRLNKSDTGRVCRSFQACPTVNTSSPKRLGLKGENRNCNQGIETLRPLAWE